MFDVKEILTGMSAHVQYISFGLLALSGMNMPISEDIVIILSASIAATIVPGNIYYIFAGCLLGAYLGDIISYCIGRFGIKKILHSEFLIRMKLIHPERLEARMTTMRNYFTSYGGKTLFFGRFIPMGMRNVIFMTCGFIHMNPVKFMVIDLCAVTCTSLVLFSLGYSFGNNYEVLVPYLNRYKFVLLALVILGVAFFIVRNKIQRRNATAVEMKKKQGHPKNAIIK